MVESYERKEETGHYFGSAASDPAKFKNKRIQVSEDRIREESEPEVVPISPPSSSKPSSTVTKSSQSHPYSPQALDMFQPTRASARKVDRKKKADSEDEYKPPSKKAKAKSKRGSRSKASKKPNTSAYGRVTDVGGKCPKHLFKGQGEASDSDTSLKSKRDDREDHSDSLTDS